MSTIIYGASDDCIEFDGDFVGEVYATSNAKTYVGLSTGHLLSVQYDGEWILRVISGANYDLYPMHDAKAEELANDYTDVIEIHDEVKWAVSGERVE